MPETPEQQQTFVQRWFWFLAAGLVLVVSAVLVLGFVAIGNRYDDLRTRLNDTYVEQIDIRSRTTSGNRSEDLFVVDGVPRFDCSEEDGLLECSEDPQPTLER